MNKIILSLLLLLFSFSVQATEIPEAAIETQENDQALCVQQRVKACLDKCQNSEGIDCNQACSENARNECRQAGE